MQGNGSMELELHLCGFALVAYPSEILPQRHKEANFLRSMPISMRVGVNDYDDITTTSLRIRPPVNGKTTSLSIFALSRSDLSTC